MVGGWETYLGYGIAALLAIDRFFSSRDKRLSDKNKQIAEETAKLTSLLQERLSVSEQKILTLEQQVINSNADIKVMRERNVVIESIFQGRDTQTQDFQKRGFEVMAEFAKMQPIILQSAEASIKTQQNIETLLKTLDKHLQITAQHDG